VTTTTLTRVELTDAIVREVGFTRQESSYLLDRMLEMISESLEGEGAVKLSRFGNFNVRRKAAREGIGAQGCNLQTFSDAQRPRRRLNARPDNHAKLRCP